MKGAPFLEHLELSEEPCLHELAACASCMCRTPDTPIIDNMINNNIIAEVMSAIPLSNFIIN
jgi:hypothetical protein